MASKECRLRKYLRKKGRAGRLGQVVVWEKWAMLYWRYHLQVHGPHVCLWNMDMDEDDGSRPMGGRRR